MFLRFKGDHDIFSNPKTNGTDLIKLFIVGDYDRSLTTVSDIILTTF